MYVNASIWTKSKFLGLSLGVHNVGSGTHVLLSHALVVDDPLPVDKLTCATFYVFAVSLHLLDYDEVYTCNLPSAYGR